MVCLALHLLTRCGTEKKLFFPLNLSLPFPAALLENSSPSTQKHEPSCPLHFFKKKKNSFTPYRLTYVQFFLYKFRKNSSVSLKHNPSYILLTPFLPQAPTFTTPPKGYDALSSSFLYLVSGRVREEMTREKLYARVCGKH